MKICYLHGSSLSDQITCLRHTFDAKPVKKSPPSEEFFFLGISRYRRKKIH